MPWLVLILLGAISYTLGRTWGRASAQPGQVVVGLVGRPPLGYEGDPIFSLPQQRWGEIECVSRTVSGYCYGVRFDNGLAVVLGEYEVVR